MAIRLDTFLLTGLLFLTTTRVEEVMTPSVVSCSENDDVRRAAEIMQSAQLRRLLVLSSSGEVAGIVSLGDLALQTRDELREGGA